MIRKPEDLPVNAIVFPRGKGKDSIQVDEIRHPPALDRPGVFLFLQAAQGKING